MIGNGNGCRLTVVAQNTATGMAAAQRFVVTATSLTEPPVFSLPQQVVVIIGQPLSLPINISDMDQEIWPKRGQQACQRGNSVRLQSAILAFQTAMH